MNIVVATVKPWNIKKASEVDYGDDVHITLIDNPQDFKLEGLREVGPEYIFIPHWSWRIIPEIYENFECVIFHETDLPFGRGGSPLQNLIERGITETRITAIRCSGNLDAGNIYCKEPLSLYGGAEEIFMRACDVIFDKMIPYIIRNRPEPIPQEGEPVIFKRRTPEMSELNQEMTLRDMFDYIRMLDADGYPNAYIKFGRYKLSLTRPKLMSGRLIADVAMEESNDE